jgi:hypothetical protein
MALARAHGVVLSGIDAHLVEVEAHLSQGLPGMSIVGLADTAVGEARDRVRAAVLNSGARWPQNRITVGLSPASLHKRGSGLDLAIATAILAADGQVGWPTPCSMQSSASTAGCDRYAGWSSQPSRQPGSAGRGWSSRALMSARPRSSPGSGPPE